MERLCGNANYNDSKDSVVGTPIRVVVAAIFDCFERAKRRPNPPVCGFLLADRPPIPPRDGEEPNQRSPPLAGARRRLPLIARFA